PTLSCPTAARSLGIQSPRLNAALASCVAAIALCVTALTHVAPARAAVPLVPRRVFSTNPSFVNAVISPDGKTLAYLARSKGGTMNLWVRSLDGGEQHVVSKDSDGDLFGAQWAADSRHLLFVHDTNGDENYHLKSLDIVTRQIRDLTPFNGVPAASV